MKKVKMIITMLLIFFMVGCSSSGLEKSMKKIGDYIENQYGVKEVEIGEDIIVIGTASYMDISYKYSFNYEYSIYSVNYTIFWFGDHSSALYHITNGRISMSAKFEKPIECYYENGYVYNLAIKEVDNLKYTDDYSDVFETYTRMLKTFDNHFSKLGMSVRN